MIDQRVSVLERTLARLEEKLDQSDAKWDARIEKMDAKWDTRFERFDERMRKFEVELAEVKGRVMHLPSTYALITTSFGAVFATIGFFTLLARMLPLR